MPPKLPTPSFLVVEDSDEDYVALQRVLHRAQAPVELLRCVCAEDVLAILKAPIIPNRALPVVPSLIVLDLNLPGLDGRTVLTAVRNHARLRTVPVVIFSTSSNPSDIEWCYANGANSYHVKEMDYTAFKRGVEMLVEYWLEAVRLPAPQGAGPTPLATEPD